MSVSRGAQAVVCDGAAGTAPGDARTARLWHAVCALAEPPPRTARKAPGATGASRPSVRQGIAEQLVFEFDEAYTAFVEGFVRLPSEAQLLALQAVDGRLSSMVRAKDAALWTEQARRDDPVWHEVRILAAEVLGVFRWPSLREGLEGETLSAHSERPFESGI